MRHTASQDLRRYFQHRVQEALNNGATGTEIAKAVGKSATWVSNLLKRPKGDFRVATADRLARYLGMSLREALGAAERWTEDAPPQPDTSDPYPNRDSALVRMRGILYPEAEKRLRTIPFAESVPDRPVEEWISIALEENRAIKRERERAEAEAAKRAQSIDAAQGRVVATQETAKTKMRRAAKKKRDAG